MSDRPSDQAPLTNIPGIQDRINNLYQHQNNNYQASQSQINLVPKTKHHITQEQSVSQSPSPLSITDPPLAKDSHYSSVISPSTTSSSNDVKLRPPGRLSFSHNTPNPSNMLSSFTASSFSTSAPKGNLSNASSNPLAPQSTLSAPCGDPSTPVSSSQHDISPPDTNDSSTLAMESTPSASNVPTSSRNDTYLRSNMTPNTEEGSSISSDRLYHDGPNPRQQQRLKPLFPSLVSPSASSSVNSQGIFVRQSRSSISFLPQQPQSSSSPQESLPPSTSPLSRSTLPQQRLIPILALVNNASMKQQNTGLNTAQALSNTAPVAIVTGARALTPKQNASDFDHHLLMESIQADHYLVSHSYKSITCALPSLDRLPHGAHIHPGGSLPSTPSHLDGTVGGGATGNPLRESFRASDIQDQFSSYTAVRHSIPLNSAADFGDALSARHHSAQDLISSIDQESHQGAKTSSLSGNVLSLSTQEVLESPILPLSWDDIPVQSLSKKALTQAIQLLGHPPRRVEQLLDPCIAKTLNSSTPISKSPLIQDHNLCIYITHLGEFNSPSQLRYLLAQRPTFQQHHHFPLGSYALPIDLFDEIHPSFYSDLLPRYTQHFDGTSSISHLSRAFYVTLSRLYCFLSYPTLPRELSLTFKPTAWGVLDLSRHLDLLCTSFMPPLSHQQLQDGAPRQFASESRLEPFEPLTVTGIQQLYSYTQTTFAVTTSSPLTIVYQFICGVPIPITIVDYRQHLPTLTQMFTSRSKAIQSYESDIPFPNPFGDHGESQDDKVLLSPTHITSSPDTPRVMAVSYTKLHTAPISFTSSLTAASLLQNQISSQRDYSTVIILYGTDYFTPLDCIFSIGAQPASLLDATQPDRPAPLSSSSSSLSSSSSSLSSASIETSPESQYQIPGPFHDPIVSMCLSPSALSLIIVSQANRIYIYHLLGQHWLYYIPPFTSQLSARVTLDVLPIDDNCRLTIADGPRGNEYKLDSHAFMVADPYLLSLFPTHRQRLLSLLPLHQGMKDLPQLPSHVQSTGVLTNISFVVLSTNKANHRGLSLVSLDTHWSFFSPPEADSSQTNTPSEPQSLSPTLSNPLSPTASSISSLLRFQNTPDHGVVLNPTKSIFTFYSSSHLQLPASNMLHQHHHLLKKSRMVYDQRHQIIAVGVQNTHDLSFIQLQQSSLLQPIHSPCHVNATHRAALFPNTQTVQHPLLTSYKPLEIGLVFLNTHRLDQPVLNLLYWVIPGQSWPDLLNFHLAKTPSPHIAKVIAHSSTQQDGSATVKMEAGNQGALRDDIQLLSLQYDVFEVRRRATVLGTHRGSVLPVKHRPPSVQPNLGRSSEGEQGQEWMRQAPHQSSFSPSVGYLSSSRQLDWLFHQSTSVGLPGSPHLVSCQADVKLPLFAWGALPPYNEFCSRNFLSFAYLPHSFWYRLIVGLVSSNTSIAVNSLHDPVRSLQKSIRERRSSLLSDSQSQIDAIPPLSGSGNATKTEDDISLHHALALHPEQTSGNTSAKSEAVSPTLPPPHPDVVNKRQAPVIPPRAPRRFTQYEKQQYQLEAVQTILRDNQRHPQQSKPKAGKSQPMNQAKPLSRPLPSNNHTNELKREQQLLNVLLHGQTTAPTTASSTRGPQQPVNWTKRALIPSTSKIDQHYEAHQQFDSLRTAVESSLSSPSDTFHLTSKNLTDAQVIEAYYKQQLESARSQLCILQDHNTKLREQIRRVEQQNVYLRKEHLLFFYQRQILLKVLHLRIEDLQDGFSHSLAYIHNPELQVILEQYYMNTVRAKERAMHQEYERKLKLLQDNLPYAMPAATTPLLNSGAPPFPPLKGSVTPGLKPRTPKHRSKATATEQQPLTKTSASTFYSSFFQKKSHKKQVDSYNVTHPPLSRPSSAASTTYHPSSSRKQPGLDTQSHQQGNRVVMTPNMIASASPLLPVDLSYPGGLTHGTSQGASRSASLSLRDDEPFIVNKNVLYHGAASTTTAQPSPQLAPKQQRPVPPPTPTRKQTSNAQLSSNHAAPPHHSTSPSGISSTHSKQLKPSQAQRSLQESPHHPRSIHGGHAPMTPVTPITDTSPAGVTSTQSLHLWLPTDDEDEGGAFYNDRNRQLLSNPIPTAEGHSAETLSVTSCSSSEDLPPPPDMADFLLSPSSYSPEISSPPPDDDRLPRSVLHAKTSNHKGKSLFHRAKLEKQQSSHEPLSVRVRAPSSTVVSIATVPSDGDHDGFAGRNQTSHSQQQSGIHGNDQSAPVVTLLSSPAIPQHSLETSHVGPSTAAPAIPPRLKRTPSSSSTTPSTVEPPSIKSAQRQDPPSFHSRPTSTITQRQGTNKPYPIQHNEPISHFTSVIPTDQARSEKSKSKLPLRLKLANFRKQRKKDATPVLPSSRTTNHGHHTSQRVFDLMALHHCDLTAKDIREITRALFAILLQRDLAITARRTSVNSSADMQNVGAYHTTRPSKSNTGSLSSTNTHVDYYDNSVPNDAMAGDVHRVHHKQDGTQFNEPSQSKKAQLATHSVSLHRSAHANHTKPTNALAFAEHCDAFLRLYSHTLPTRGNEPIIDTLLSQMNHNWAKDIAYSTWISRLQHQHTSLQLSPYASSFVGQGKNNAHTPPHPRSSTHVPLISIYDLDSFAHFFKTQYEDTLDTLRLSILQYQDLARCISVDKYRDFATRFEQRQEVDRKYYTTRPWFPQDTTRLSLWELLNQPHVEYTSDRYTISDELLQAFLHRRYITDEISSDYSQIAKHTLSQNELLSMLHNTYQTSFMQLQARLANASSQS